MKSVLRMSLCIDCIDGGIAGFRFKFQIENGYEQGA